MIHGSAKDKRNKGNESSLDTVWWIDNTGMSSASCAAEDGVSTFRVGGRWVVVILIPGLGSCFC
jgi:hypothetical protein